MWARNYLSEYWVDVGGLSDADLVHVPRHNDHHQFAAHLLVVLVLGDLVDQLLLHVLVDVSQFRTFTDQIPERSAQRRSQSIRPTRPVPPLVVDRFNQGWKVVRKFIQVPTIPYSCHPELDL